MYASTKAQIQQQGILGALDAAAWLRNPSPASLELGRGFHFVYKMNEKFMETGMGVEVLL